MRVGKNGLTQMEHKLVKNIAKGMTNRDAGLLAGYKATSIDQSVISALKRDRVKLAIQKALDRAGITDDKIAQTLKKTMSGAGRDATNSDAIRTIEVIGKIRGWHEADKEGITNNTYINELKILNISDLKARADKLTQEIEELTS